MAGKDADIEFTAEAMQAVRELLEAGQDYGIGITFEPDAAGWHVGYMQGMGGGNLASGYDLEIAVKAAQRPLDELHDKLEANRAERDATP